MTAHSTQTEPTMSNIVSPTFTSTTEAHDWAIRKGFWESEFMVTWDVTEHYIDLGRGEILIQSEVITLDESDWG